MQVLEREQSSAAKAPSNPALGSRLTQRIARDFKPRWDQQWGGKFMLHGRTPDSNAIRLDGNDYLSGSRAIRRSSTRRSRPCARSRSLSCSPASST
jgi:hypothetical protein